MNTIIAILTRQEAMNRGAKLLNLTDYFKVVPQPAGEQVVFTGCRCDFCGEKVKTLHGHPVNVVEAVEGKPTWRATHQKCAEKRQERAARGKASQYLY